MALSATMTRSDGAGGRHCCGSSRWRSRRGRRAAPACAPAWGSRPAVAAEIWSPIPARWPAACGVRLRWGTVDEIQSGGTVFQIPSAPGPLVAVRSHMDGHLSPSDFGNQQQPFHPSSLYCCSPRRRTELEAARRPTSQSPAAARITSDSDNCDLRELYRYWMLTPPDKVEWHGGAMAGVVPGVLSTAASLPPAMARAFTSMTQ